MEIELKKIRVEDLVADYEDDAEGGVRGYGGRLDIRPPYQREFVYDAKERNKVIDTLTQDFPLNVMYWSVRNDGSYEVIDGQQRTSYRQSYNDLTPNVRAYFHMYRESRSETSKNEIKKAMLPAIEAAADLFNLLDGPISKKADYQALSDALAEYAKALEQIMTPLLDVVNAQHAIVLENELKTFNSEIRQRVAQLQIEGEVDLPKLLEQFD